MVTPFGGWVISSKNLPLQNLIKIVAALSRLSVLRRFQFQEVALSQGVFIYEYGCV